MCSSVQRRIKAQRCDGNVDINNRCCDLQLLRAWEEFTATTGAPMKLQGKSDSELKAAQRYSELRLSPPLWQPPFVQVSDSKSPPLASHVPAANPHVLSLLSLPAREMSAAPITRTWGNLCIRKHSDFGSGQGSRVEQLHLLPTRAAVPHFLPHSASSLHDFLLSAPQRPGQLCARGEWFAQPRGICSAGKPHLEYSPVSYSSAGEHRVCSAHRMHPGPLISLQKVKTEQ